ncbi:hypothetical protein DTO96_102384 [Ephemeroptericola cinctiostellae]|uniref:Uncharacterized protein n=1 Tax=Ephemeroptericola cinctiostellae TaxID=2268024 RepID=A0A345DE41_9BURK|nr:hypothetical protein [Ephemeroptericola cinctiostellae]AXF86629.1 hypothetical protein DTO96_102384 [Ephemeroptericola cinctiostellae]
MLKQPNTPVLYTGLPIALAYQFASAVGGLPVDMSNCTGIELWAASGAHVRQFDVRAVNAEQGLFTAIITDTSSLPAGCYVVQGRYIDSSGRHVPTVKASITLEKGLWDV